MYKVIGYLCALTFLALAVQCGSKEMEKQSPPEENALATDLDMFGYYIKRGLTKTSEGLAEGYVLFAPTNSASIYLVDREGKVVHEWKGNYTSHTPYLNDDGSITQLAVDVDFPVFAAGGEAGRVQKISWDSKILWDFEYANEDHCTHHDIALKPNGNVLAISWEARMAEAVLEAGRKPDLIPKAGLWPSRVVEIEPNGKYGGKVVWQWQIWDHLIQDYDASKDNYGEVAAHPELLDFNAGRPLPPPITQDSMDKLQAAHSVRRNVTVYNGGSDVYHLNAINYNSELEQIALSSPRLNEIFIIDQSTTTKEAAGHTGGRWGKGGDILYRWGNPQNYRNGDSTQQRLFGQHDVRWIEAGLPGAGNLTVFNNNVPLIPDSLSFSAVVEIKPPMDDIGNYILGEDGTYGPAETEWTYVADDTLSFYSAYVSGAHRMANGNTFINQGAKGRFFEVTTEGEVVWEYFNPYRGNIRYPNGDPKSLMPDPYWQFRAYFIPADHPGLKGRELKPLDPQPERFKLPPKEPEKEL